MWYRAAHRDRESQGRSFNGSVDDTPEQEPHERPQQQAIR